MKSDARTIIGWERLCEPENWHPAACMFPMLKNDEGFKLEDLVKSITQTGLLNPIVLQDGKVLDGRNRLAACKLAGKEPLFVDFESLGFEGSIEEWVGGQNASRRDLTPSQKAFAALYVIKNFKPTQKQKDAFTVGGTKWDRR